MNILSFQSENPSEIDAFKGGSHDRVATAIHNYLLNDKNHKVIGLDGEFGSGKSSILQMLEKKIVDVDSATRLWLFDCEQNYQGSIKSNFIELLTEQVLLAIPPSAKASVRENVLRNRDIALGRHVSYTKDTRSHISIWAVLLIAGGVLSPTLLRDYLSQLHQKDPLEIWKHGLYVLGIIFPAVSLGLAMFANRGKGKKKWNLSSILKGSSDDHITETIEISKEVSPLDLKRTLDQHLEAVSGTNFIIVIDNLDRLPREALRSVWSDLEIFTSVSRRQNLSIIVPFCSTKVSKYLNGDNEKSYDSKDFIAKKFPVVFRAPPIITSGWKDAFRTLWTQSFGSLPLEQADICSLILKRHSPMAAGLVTPRLQKRFINDLATTLLVTVGDPKMEVIAAYIMICKYNGTPIETLLSYGTTSKSDDAESAETKQDDPVDANKLQKTRELLTGLYGEDVDSGWPIQILQVHFQTSKDIAIAELIDQPLATAIEEQNGKKLAELSSYFGFMDSFTRYLEGDISAKSLLQTLHFATAVEGFDIAKIIPKVSARLAGSALMENVKGDTDFYAAIGDLTKAGLSKSLFSKKLQILASEFDQLHEYAYDAEHSDEHIEAITTYDAYLHALDESFNIRTVSSAENLFHLIVGREDLHVIDIADIKLDSVGVKDALKQITSTVALTNSMTPMQDTAWESCFVTYFGRLLLGHADQSTQFDDPEFLQILSFLPSNASDDRFWLALAMYKNYVPQIAAIINAYSASLTSVRAKLAIASIYLRQGMLTELAAITGISKALEESPLFFDALVKSVVADVELMEACVHPDSLALMAPVFVRQVRTGSIGVIDSPFIYRNFDVLTHALQPYGLSEDELLNWFAAAALSPANVPSFEELDPLILHRILSSDHPMLTKLREHLFEERFVKLDAQGWAKVIGQESRLQLLTLQRLLELNWPVSTFTHAHYAALSYLTGVSKQSPFAEPAIYQIETLLLVIKLLSQSDRSVLGTELRELLYSSECTPAAGLYLLANFGALIPTFVPVNEVESGRLLQLLNLVGSDTPYSTEAAKFLNSRYQQLISWTPGDLMATYMEIVTQRKDQLPHVYESLSNKKGIKRQMKLLTDKFFS
ncbi:P-loop NTPase fold protein [Pseudomonas viridiflava]|uniref:P-loop NTPase fold protein n=3 Tax=Pseudomonas viridiflava TaxID=33069 RepID=UPI0013CF156F|nr:P-loop NTPase fold protein [Pseudomonas viridiflava]